jgi:hypothetical protein
MPEAEVWYHGSPHQLSVLRKGSTITQDRKLAEVFSHKPTLVSMEDDGRIRHNGLATGYLYAIDEAVRSEDVVPHPNTTMAPGKEWLTRRPLRLRLLRETQLSEENRLCDDEVTSFLRRLVGMHLQEEAQHDEA